MSGGDLNNVDRMMRELNVEQLVQIQSSLKGEMDKKREELRRMVGRRYRDVLEASNTVKRLSEIANELASLLANIGQNVAYGQQQKDKPTSEMPSVAGEDGTKLVAPKLLRPNASRCFLLLQNLLSMSFVSDDPLVRAFCLCVADFFHRTLSSSDSFALPFSHPPVVPLFSDQFIHFRMELLDICTSKMGSAGFNWNLSVSALVAYLLLRPRTTADELLQLFLKSRMDFLMENLRQPDSTLLGLIKQMKDTVQSAEQIFAQCALISAIQCVTTKGWSPDIVESFVDNQPMSARQLLKTAIERVNGICPSFELPARSEVQKQCSDWAVKMCEIVGERVRKMCSYFEQVDQAVEFAVAVGQLFKSNWSSVFESNTLIYRQLFGTALSDRFRELIAIELAQLEHQIRSKMAHINCEPLPLFHKRSATFDPLLASGISRELNEQIQQMNDTLHLLHQNIGKYILISQEHEAEQLHEALADHVLAFVDRLTDFTSWDLSPDCENALLPLPNSFTSLPSNCSAPPPTLSSENAAARSRWLAVFRLLLALVQHEPSMLCQCMNRNVDKIVRCNRTLHKATERALCRFMDFVIDHCGRTTNVCVVMRECCATWDGWAELLQEPERVQLRETVTLDVPTQLSKHLFLFLASIYREINHHSLGHLFTRSVTLHVSQRIGKLLAQLLCQCTENCAPIPQIHTQLLLDAKTLFLMFSDKCFLDIVHQLETKMDPIELNVLQAPIARNAKLFAQRTAMLFGQLQAEPLTTLKDAQLPSSYSQLIDITPKGFDVPRLTQIPRLSKLKEDSQSVEDSATSIKQSKKGRKAKTAGASEVGGLGLPVKGVSTASFSSLYDKISTGWFKS
ncbi:hypothetical protein niasHS_001455 [Heterodera schachtii]|uniref:Conserved oligomeric Golgi complex subunit 1 n=1 Tax=Heterodera schachtii TaxID=97005 RepID=A0ABD2KDG8_HETSC